MTRYAAVDAVRGPAGADAPVVYVFGGHQVGEADTAPQVAISATEDRIWTAAVVAEDLGVARERVEEIMSSLVPFDDFVAGRGGERIATARGLEKIRTALDGGMALSTSSGQAPVAAPVTLGLRGAPARGRTAGPEKPPGNGPRTGDLLVTRIWGAKRVLCNRVDNGLEVTCRVQASANLLPGLVLAGAVESEPGLWSYYGRLPRRKGKW